MTRELKNWITRFIAMLQSVASIWPIVADAVCDRHAWADDRGASRCRLTYPASQTNEMLERRHWCGLEAAEAEPAAIAAVGGRGQRRHRSRYSAIHPHPAAGFPRRGGEVDGAGVAEIAANARHSTP